MIELKLERVVDIRGELEELARLEYDEMEVGWRPFAPDWHSFIESEKAGIFKVLTARKDRKLVGYLSWMIDFDMEAYGTLIVHQCAWYVEPGNYGVAVGMFNRAIEEFRVLGVKFVYLHNSVRGRGRTLGRFFEKNGAQLCSQNYVLRL